jgi:hypothetical protein
LAQILDEQRVSIAASFHCDESESRDGFVGQFFAPPFRRIVNVMKNASNNGEPCSQTEGIGKRLAMLDCILFNDDLQQLVPLPLHRAHDGPVINVVDHLDALMPQLVWQFANMPRSKQISECCFVWDFEWPFNDGFGVPISVGDKDPLYEVCPSISSPALKFQAIQFPAPMLACYHRSFITTDLHDHSFVLIVADELSHLQSLEFSQGFCQCMELMPLFFVHAMTDAAQFEQQIERRHADK